VQNGAGNGGSRPTTPKSAPPRASSEAHGLLIIQIMQGRGLSLPAGTVLPDAIQRALAKNTHAHTNSTRSTRESVSRKRNWWLPYVVLEFDKNEILIDALGGDVASPIWAYRAHFDVCRQSDISVSAYLRSDAPAHAGAGELGNKDILVARVDLTPVLDAPWNNDRWYTATAGTGEFRLVVQFRPSNNEPLTIEAFDLLKVIGKGSFGKVMQVCIDLLELIKSLCPRAGSQEGHESYLRAQDYPQSTYRPAPWRGAFPCRPHSPLSYPTPYAVSPSFPCHHPTPYPSPTH